MTVLSGHFPAKLTYIVIKYPLYLLRIQAGIKTVTSNILGLFLPLEIYFMLLQSFQPSAYCFLDITFSIYLLSIYLYFSLQIFCWENLKLTIGYILPST